MNCAGCDECGVYEYCIFNERVKLILNMLRFELRAAKKEIGCSLTDEDICEIETKILDGIERRGDK